jgi:hypothetical protein
MKKIRKNKTEEAKTLKLPKTPKAPRTPKTLKTPKTPGQQQHRVINSLVGNLNNALENEENTSEINELLDENPQVSRPLNQYHDREQRPVKYKFYLVFGLLVFWLAIVGGIVTVRSVGEFFYDVSNRTALKEEFERFVLPVVITDPPEFSGVENLTPGTVIASAIWKIILSDETSDERRDSETGMVIIPESDVEAAVRSIFGAGFDVEHRSIDYIVMAFRYVPEERSYHVPGNPNYLTFSPRVTEISNTGETYRIVVEYIAPTPLLIAGIEHEIIPIKSMVYTINRSRGRDKIIQSIEFNREREMQL